MPHQAHVASFDARMRRDPAMLVGTALRFSRAGRAEEAREVLEGSLMTEQKPTATALRKTGPERISAQARSVDAWR